jgi:hypothetical protein
MMRGIGVAMLAIGIILLVLGINSSHAVGSKISETFQGTPTNQVIWYFIGAAAVGIPGLFLALFPRSKKA